MASAAEDGRTAARMAEPGTPPAAEEPLPPKSPRWPFTPARTATREAFETVEVQRIIESRRDFTEATWAKSTWRHHILAADAITSPQRVTPRFRSKTPRHAGPLYADRPMHVPLPAGQQHEGFQQTAYRRDVRPGAARPPNPRRLPTEMPSPRVGESPRWKTTVFDHTYGWRF